MHRSRLPVLAIVAAAAACSTHGSSSDEGNDALSHDSTLVARLADDQPRHALPLPSSCGAVALAARPTSVHQHEAQELTRQALDAEIHGSIGDARSLLRRASELDGTNKSVAYHLGRTSEALHDSTSALAAYCRYLALGPTVAESAEARMRVAALTQHATRVAAGSAISTSASRTAHVRHVTVGSAGLQRPPASTSRPLLTHSARQTPAVPRTAPSGTYETPTTSESATASSRADGGISGAAGGEVVATSAPSRDDVPPEAAPSSAQRGPSRTQGALVGAAAGAIIGAATGRSVKGAVMGAAAGGILGAVVVRPSAPRRWARR